MLILLFLTACVKIIFDNQNFTAALHFFFVFYTLILEETALLPHLYSQQFCHTMECRGKCRSLVQKIAFFPRKIMGRTNQYIMNGDVE